MANEMVERVARAIEASYGDRIFTPDWQILAKAAIAAMREPTKEMADEGGDALDDCKDGGYDSGSDGESCNSYEYIISGSQTTIYQAMIDAALSDTPEPTEASSPGKLDLVDLWLIATLGKPPLSSADR